MYSYDRRRVAAAGGPDPLTLKAFLSEFESGVKKGVEESDQVQRHPAALMNLEVEAQAEIKDAALELKKHVDRLVRISQSGSVKLNPRLFASEISEHLSTLLYQAGRYDGLHESYQM